MVHQHFMLVPVFTVAENVVLGVEPTGPLDHLDLDKARAAGAARSATEHGLEVDPDAIIEEMPVGLQQRVEIIKVLFRSADVIIFDEPTAVLTPQEVIEFFGIIRSLRDAGKALVFITHKLARCSRSPTGSACSAAARSSARATRRRRPTPTSPR